MDYYHLDQNLDAQLDNPLNNHLRHHLNRYKRLHLDSGHMDLMGLCYYLSHRCPSNHLGHYLNLGQMGLRHQYLQRHPHHHLNQCH